MPNTSNINLDQIEPNTIALVRGRISFSRVATQIANDELAADIARRRNRGWAPVERPYTTITLHSAEVLCKNPAAPTLFEQYLNGRMYTSGDTTRNPGRCFSAVNKGRYVPSVGALQADGTYEQVHLESELAANQEVILVMRCFGAKMHNGLTFDTVLVQSPQVQYAGGANDTSRLLADAGIVFKTTPAPAPAPATPVVEEAPQTMQPAPAPMTQAQPLNAPAQAMPPASGAPMAAPAAPMGADMGMFAPAPAVNPTAIPAPGQIEGINYDPNAR